MLSKTLTRLGGKYGGRSNFLRHSTSLRSFSDENQDSGKKDKDVMKKEIPAAGKYFSPWIILKEEVKSIAGAFSTGQAAPLQNKIPRETDVLIIGGGLVGNSCAYWLKQKCPRGINITVIERDYGYTRASSMLSAGGIRHQFSLPENIQMSMFTTEFIRNLRDHLSVLDHEPPDVQFNHQGYLFLATPEKAAELETCVKLQRELGAKIDLMSKERLKDKFPWINVDGIEAGSYGLQGEGWFDPWLLLKALRQKNVNRDVVYSKGEVVGFGKEKRGHAVNDDSGILRTVQIKDEEGVMHHMKFCMVINCAGAWAGEVAKMAGIGSGEDLLSIPLPVEPRKRFIYVFHCQNGPGIESPMCVDPTGVYFRREGLGGNYICGASPEEVITSNGIQEKEPDTSTMDVDYEFFEERIWPVLAHRYPQFEKIKLKSAWAGFYDYNYVDQNLIIGPHPTYQNFWFANGMSGHGLQQSVAIGRAISELFIEHKFTTIDLSKYSFNRVIMDEPVEENFIV